MTELMAAFVAASIFITGLAGVWSLIRDTMR